MVQSARIMLQYSANARDVHMLRSVPERLCIKAAELFDNARDGFHAIRGLRSGRGRRRRRRWAEAAGGLDWMGTRQRAVERRLQLTGVGAGMGGGGGREEG